MKSVKNIEVIEKQKATLEFVVSEPNMKAKWTKNGKEINFDEDI